MKSSAAWKVYSYVLLVFVFGICTGLFAGLRLGKQPEPSAPIRPHQEYETNAVEYLARTLELTSEQVKAVPGIVKKSIQANQGTTARMMTEIETNTLKMFGELSGLLDEDQKLKLDDVVEFYRANKIKIINEAFPVYSAISEAF